jgi:hypothetical protein
MPGGLRTEIHLTASDTGGAFCLLTFTPAGMEEFFREAGARAGRGGRPGRRTRRCDPAWPAVFSFLT